MSVRPDPVIPETRRRRASTTEKSERILKMSRSLTLTRSVLAGTLAEATPNQLDFIERWFTAELDSRERSKRLRLLKQAGFPADKTLDGYDWTNLKMPADWGRAQLENLDFVAGCEDLVLYGPVGTGKSHLAIAIGRLACERGVPVRFFTATGLLMRLRRAQQENRLDRELASIGKARLLIIDEFGYLPIDEEGSRLLFQIISDSYETRSIIYATNIEFSGWGRVLGDKNMAAALIDRTVHHGRLIRFEGCLCSISCCGFSHDDFSGLGRACRPRNGLNWMVLVSPPERTGKDYDQHAPSTVYPSFAAERGIRRVDRAENTCQRADGA